jgi:hypothetical protein
MISGQPAFAVSTRIKLLIVECPPQPPHRDIGAAALSCRPADLDRLFLEPNRDASRDKLADLIGIKAY